MDLSHAMHDAARVATAPRPPMAPGPVLQRIRRRRAARYAVQGTAAVAAAGAVALGGAHLAGRPLPVPASTPTPTADQYPPPAGIGCGTVLADVPDLQPTDDTTNLMIEARLTDDAFEQGAPVTGDLTVWFRSDAARDGNVGEQTMLVAVRDGVVVGIPEPTVNGEPPTTYGTPGTNPRGDASSVQQLNKRLLACEADGTATTPLAAGSYELYAVVLGVERADSSWNPVPFLGGPWTLDVVPAAEPAVEAAVDPHPALEDLVISTSGLGPLTVGLPPATNPGAGMITFDEDYCVELNGGSWDPAMGPAGEWIPSGYPQVPDFWGNEAVDPFRLAASDMVGRIDIRSPLLHTAEGIGIGSTLTELLAAYPDVVEKTEMANWSRAWVLQDEPGTLLFETAGSLDGYLPELTEETVISIRITAPGAPYSVQTLGTGDVVGNCGLT